VNPTTAPIGALASRARGETGEEERATVSATLTVKREGFVLELRRAPFEITLDGTTVGSINRHETFETPIEPGHHRLQIRAARYSSRAQSFDVADGDAVNFRCYGGRIWPIYAISFVVPSLALLLKRE
jgi:hypothetical protein